MQDIHLISQYIDIKDKKVFDIGSANGKFASFFMDRGGKVFAIDIKDKTKPECKNNPNFLFQEANIDTFETKDTFDIIFSRNVFSFCESDLEKLLEKVKNNLVKDGVIFFTYFGNKEIWTQDGKLKSLTRAEIDTILEDNKKDFDIQYFAEELFQGLTMDGGTKSWHIFRVILKKK